MELNYKIIGARIREKRISKKWTQAKLAEKAGIEPSNISHIERAATKLSLPTLISIANALETTLDELVYGNLVKNAHISIGIIEDLLRDCSAAELKSVAEMIITTKRILRSDN